MASAAPAVVTALAPGPPRPGSPGRFPRPRDLAGGRIGPSVPSAAFGSVWSRRWSLRMVGWLLLASSEWRLGSCSARDSPPSRWRPHPLPTLEGQTGPALTTDSCPWVEGGLPRPLSSEPCQLTLELGASSEGS